MTVNENKEEKILIRQERFEQLIRLEERVNIAVEYIMCDSYVDKANVLRILGTGEAIRYAAELQEKEEAERMEYLKKMGEFPLTEEE